jgi:hypothetical protein
MMRTYGSRREAYDANETEADEAEQRRYARIKAQQRLNERLEKRMQVEATLNAAFPR